MVPQGWKLAQIELLERIQESLGSFISDHGWSQSDMDAADALDGFLAAAPQPPAAARDVARWMGIGKAIERACMDLPDGTEISVSLEKDAGTVTLIDQDGNEYETFRVTTALLAF